MEPNELCSVQNPRSEHDLERSKELESVVILSKSKLEVKESKIMLLSKTKIQNNTNQYAATESTCRKANSKR